MSGAPEALVCGAGKIGRGFVGQLLHRSGYALHFFDADAMTVERLRRARRYRVEIAGNAQATEYVPVAGAWGANDTAELEELFGRVAVVFSCVGAGHLKDLAAFTAPMLGRRLRQGPLNWFVCENADGPAVTMRDQWVSSGVAADGLERLGVIETQVLRSGMLPDEEILAREPLALRMQDWWTLPANADAVVGDRPAIEGVEWRRHFADQLRRKLFTFNGLNGPIAYIGYAAGHRRLDVAANDPTLQGMWEQIQRESAHGLLAEYAFDAREHGRFQRLAFDKYRDPVLADSIERNARDTARKLGPAERLVGPAALCLKHGLEPAAYARAIAAAIAYDGSEDSGTLAVRACLREAGMAGVLRRFCSLDPQSGLGALVLRVAAT